MSRMGKGNMQDTVGCSQSCDRAYSSFQLNLPSRLTLLFNSVLGVTKFATFSVSSKNIVPGCNYFEASHELTSCLNIDFDCAFNKFAGVSNSATLPPSITSILSLSIIVFNRWAIVRTVAL